MSLEAILRASRRESEMTKLSEAEQDAFGRIAARGFMEKLAELTFGEDQEKVAAKGAKGAKKALKAAGLIGGGAAAGGAGGFAVGRKKGGEEMREKKTQKMRSILTHLHRTGRLR